MPGAGVPLKAVVADARAQSDTWDRSLEIPSHPMLAISTCSFPQRRDRMGVVLAALVGVPCLHVYMTSLVVFLKILLFRELVGQRWIL